MDMDVVISMGFRKSIPESLMKDIQLYGCMTGSKIFGGWTAPESDIDIILPPTFPHSFQVLIDAGGLYTSDYAHEDSDFKSIYVKFPNRRSVYNLLLFREIKTFTLWWKATLTLKNMIYADADVARNMKDKRKRVALFELLKTFSFEEPPR